LNENEQEVDKHSAIPSWSGFIYQGKVGLYYALRLINTQRIDEPEQCCLKFETLEDFVVYDSQQRAFSLHQVKAIKNNKRSGYQNALKQASAVNHDDQCTEQTLRYFHVSQKLDDTSDFPGNTEHGENLVSFYEYCDNKKHVPVDEIDSLVKKQIKQYLQANELNDSDSSISLIRAKMEALIASRVNIAHRKNQNGKRKFEAAESTPVRFEELVNILSAQLLDAGDEQTILIRYRRHLLNRFSEMLTYFEDEEENNNVFFHELTSCYNGIAKMNNDTLKKLYYAKSPNQNSLKLEGFGDNSTDRYADIIAELKRLRVSEKDKTLPHYYLPERKERYLPSVIELGGRGEKQHLANLQKNIEGIKTNLHVQHVLYEYENLIIKDMNTQAFRLKDKSNVVNKITDIENEQDSESSKITKMMNIRFVPLVEAKNELEN